MLHAFLIGLLVVLVLLAVFNTAMFALCIRDCFKGEFAGKYQDAAICFFFLGGGAFSFAYFSQMLFFFIF